MLHKGQSRRPCFAQRTTQPARMLSTNKAFFSPKLVNVGSSVEEEVWNILYARAVYCTNIEGSNQNAKAGICTTKEPCSWICRNLCKPLLAHAHTEHCRSIKGHGFIPLWASLVIRSSGSSAGTQVYSKGHFSVEQLSLVCQVQKQLQWKFYSSLRLESLLHWN